MYMIWWHSWHGDNHFFTTDKCSKATIISPLIFITCLLCSPHWRISWSVFELTECFLLSDQVCSLCSLMNISLWSSHDLQPQSFSLPLISGFYFTTLLIRFPNPTELSALLYLLEFAEDDYCVLNHFFFQTTQWSPPVWVRDWRVIKMFALCWLWSFLSL